MTQFTSNAEIIVLCGSDSAQRPDLAEKAAEQGASIAEMHTFEVGDVASHDDLTKVSAVVSALTRAIETRRNVWAPFPGADIGREEHLRRLGLVLQRHGLNLLLGRELAASPITGGFSAVDHALRVEVHAVDALDQTVLAAVGVEMLGMEIERALTGTGDGADAGAVPDVAHWPDDANAVGEKYYSTAEVAKLFGKSNQWCYWAIRNNMFTRPDGTVIEPIRAGNRKWRFTTPLLREIARSWYRRGNLSENELGEILTVLAQAEGR
ncbi:DUF7229 domain-containing protein [Mycolicibacterium septicum]|uniref:DUF7229 domain-containing protein n=1 Tax=Mycolicibacterium septicum TaxID=98668 RepID=UPI001AF49D57|nr:hypothetical protein [Mycolicibacterium septicum]QRY53817.1 hypothetical protein JVX95_11120 [Mycolicibacterium septicum]